MSGHGDNDNFWPGYVDAISNLVLNLLFVVAILTIAVFLFAIELGRKQGLKIGAVDKDQGAPVKTDVVPLEDKKRLEDELTDMRKQVAVLKEKAARQAKAAADQAARKAAEAEKPVEPPREAESEKPEPALKPDPGASKTPPKRVEATEKTPVPEKDIEKLQYNGAEVIIDFNPDSVTLTKDEQDAARKALTKVAASGGARIVVRVPGAFSEARRLAFYRAMAVRNVLIEMNVAAERIDVSVQETKTGDSSKVFVNGAK